jgi:hypothetical protein
VGKAHDALASVASRDSCDSWSDSRCYGRIGLGTWDHIPAFLLDHLNGDGIAIGDSLAIDAAVPLAEVDLGKG